VAGDCDAVGDGELTQELLYRRPIERLGFCRWRRCGGGGPHGGGGSHGGGAGRAIMAEVLQCHVFARPDFAMGGPHSGGGPHGTPLGLGTRSRHGEAGVPERRFTVGGSGKSVARCHRTVFAYWKFESVSLQR